MEISRIKQWLLLIAVEKSPPVPSAEGTCDWILEHPSFLEWMHSEVSRTLWVVGHQGYGKSVLAGYLLAYLGKKGCKTIFYQFQRSGSTTQSSPTSLVSSIISQLLEGLTESPLDTDVYHQLRNLVTQSPLGPHHCAFDKMWAVTVSLLKLCKQRIFLIIDAMDECLPEGPIWPSTSTFLENLSAVLREEGSMAAIFTRPEPAFGRAMQAGPSIFMAKEILLPDIITYSKQEYRRLGLPPHQMDEVLKFISSFSEGSFRWTELLLHFLGQSLQVEDIRTRMRTLPPSIHDLYRQSLDWGTQSFSREQLDCRKSLFLVLFQAQRSLRVDEIADALSLRPERADIIISSLCKPLVSTYGGLFQSSHPSVREFFDLYCQSDNNSLGISFSDSHVFLAEKCLSCLMRERFTDLHRIGSVLKANYGEDARDNVEAPAKGKDFYDYASRFWDYHLVRIESPSGGLLKLANKFLLSLQFTYWSECLRLESGQLVKASVTLDSLFKWRKRLPTEHQELLKLDIYFEQAYSLLSDALNSGHTDKALQWLARMSIGDFYFIQNDVEKETQWRKEVLGGLDRLLGPRHRLTLSARSGMAFVNLYAGKCRASRRMYDEIVNIQQGVLGERSAVYLNTLSFKGQSEYFMADFVAAIMTWTKVSTSVLGLQGSDSWEYLATQLWYAKGMVYMGQLDAALRVLKSVADKRYEIFGPNDSFAKVVQTIVGEVQLLLGRTDESLTTLLNSLAWVRELSFFGYFRLGVEITAAIAYHAVGMDDSALVIIQELEARVGSSHGRFCEYCQLIHLKGIILAKRGMIDEAINLLQTVVTDAEEDQINRALLWILLDLATLLRRRNAEEDQFQASANFDNIVKDISGNSEPGFSGEPDPPRLLATAEKALRLVRARKHLQARQELESEGLDWRRPSDFWLWLTGPFYKDFLSIPE